MSNPVEISTQEFVENVEMIGEFELDRAKSKNNIALGHETHNSNVNKHMFCERAESERMIFFLHLLNFILDRSANNLYIMLNLCVTWTCHMLIFKCRSYE